MGTPYPNPVAVDEDLCGAGVGDVDTRYLLQALYTVGFQELYYAALSGADGYVSHQS